METKPKQTLTPLSLCIGLLHWSVSPLLDALFLGVRTFQSIHDARWMLPLRGCVLFFRLIIGAQILFACGIIVQITWSLFCVLLCQLGAYVKSHEGSNTLADFLNTYYWPMA